MERMQMSTIYYKDDYTNKLLTRIYKLEKELVYLEKLQGYFIDNNITIYNKFDKRDFDKIKKHLGEFIYYNNCNDNIGIIHKKEFGREYIQLYVNNDNCYNSDIEISHIGISDIKEYHNVQEQIENRINYISNILNECYKLQNDFDAIIESFNSKVKDFKTFVDNNGIKQILDIYIYANYND